MRPVYPAVTLGFLLASAEVLAQSAVTVDKNIPATAPANAAQKVEAKSAAKAPWLRHHALSRSPIWLLSKELVQRYCRQTGSGLRGV